MKKNQMVTATNPISGKRERGRVVYPPFKIGLQLKDKELVVVLEFENPHTGMNEEFNVPLWDIEL